MYKVEVTRSDGTKATIEAENVVVLHSTNKVEGISCFADREDDRDILPLIAKGKSMYVKAGSKENKPERLATVALADIVFGAEFRSMIDKESARIEAEETPKMPYGEASPFNIPPLRNPWR